MESLSSARSSPKPVSPRPGRVFFYNGTSMGLPYSNYFVLSQDDIKALLVQASTDPALANQFWDRFLYKIDLVSGNYSKVVNALIDLLNQCHAVDADAYSRIHKGTPYYWLGTAAYLQNDYQTAAFFYDAAVSEDLEIGAHPIHNPTPALYFMTLRSEPDRQAARQLVDVSQARVQSMLDIYNAMTGKPAGAPNLTIEALRYKFFIPAVTPGNPEWRTLATAFISFFIEWDFRNRFFDIRPGDGTAKPFFLHLFKGCVLFESLLKANPTQANVGDTLGQALNNLSNVINSSNNLPIGRTTFAAIVADLPNADDRIETAILFTGRVRNTVGHNLGWVVNINKLQYQRLFEMIASSCMHAVACLY